MLSLSRTIGIMAHVDAGKTTVSERMLVYAGRLRHAGNIDAGNTHLDTTPEETSKGITISAAATSFVWRPRVGLDVVGAKPPVAEAVGVVVGEVLVAGSCLDGPRLHDGLVMYVIRPSAQSIEG